MKRLDEIPLFPLNTVLFPGGLLPLRIFEARYLDMISDWRRADQQYTAVPVDVRCTDRIGTPFHPPQVESRHEIGRAHV